MGFSEAILIPSCDKFSDLWQPFFTQFWKNWPDCPYPVYLGSNTKKYHDRKIKNVLTGPDPGWGVSLRIFLQHIPQRHLFVWPEDAIITSAIDNRQFQKCFDLMKKYSAKHLHYRCHPKPEGFIADKFLGVYPKGMPYRVNMAGFWEKSFLMNILIDGENSWNFEIMGSYRASYDSGFYCLNQPLFSAIHLSEKCKWNKEAVSYCLANNIKIDLSKREFNTSDFLKKLQDAYFNFLINKNWRLRLKIMNILRKLLISY